MTVPVGTFSRGVGEEVLVRGGDCEPCGRNTALDEDARLGWIKDLTLWP